MLRAGIRLLRDWKPNLVFFSTTAFPLMSLGPEFRRTCGTRYVLDFQDPWVNPGGSVHPSTLKHRLVRGLHQRLEAKTVPHASGLIAVSQNYLQVLEQRFPETKVIPKSVVPFGTCEADLELARQISSASRTSWPEELRADLAQKTVGLYAGAYVKTMEPMVRRLFQAVAKLPLTARPSLKLWFIGSNYAISDRRTPIRELARIYNVDGIVRELPQRVPFHDALAMNQLATFNLLFGSSNKGYNPSKLFSLLMTERPLLAFVQPDTTVEALLRKAGGSQMAVVQPETDQCDLDFEKFLDDISARSLPALDRSYLSEYSAEALAKRQTDLFDQAVGWESTCGC